jgi:hypothetical protein
VLNARDSDDILIEGYSNFYDLKIIGELGSKFFLKVKYSLIILIFKI